MSFFQLILSGEIIGLIYMRNAYVRVQIGHDGLVVQFNGQTNFKVCIFKHAIYFIFKNLDLLKIEKIWYV